MTNEQYKILKYIQKGIDDFNIKHKHLISVNSSERSLYPHIAESIKVQLKKTEYSEYDYDIEYNRSCNLDDTAIKQLDGENISVDIIFHKRGHNEILGYENLIHIEVKKDSNLEGYIEDEKRLSKLTSREYKFNYIIGVMLSVKNKLEIKSVFFFI